MAEIGTIAAALQLAEAALKLKQLWSNISNAPSELRDLVEEVAALADVLAEIPQTSQSLPVHGQRAWEGCYKLFKASVTAMSQVTSELKSLLKSHKTTGAVRLYLKRDQLNRSKDKLERVKTTMLLAQQAYSSAILTQQNESLLHEIRAVAMWQQGQNQKVQSNLVVVGNRDAIGGQVEPSKPVVSSSHTPTIRQPRKRQAQSTYYLKVPTWIAQKGIQILLNRSNSSWGITFRCWNMVPRESEVFKAARKDDWENVFCLLDSDKASPFDVDPLGQTLLEHAMRTGNTRAYRMLLTYGLNPMSIPSKSLDSSPLMSLVQTASITSFRSDRLSLLLSHPDVYLDINDIRSQQNLTAFGFDKLTLLFKAVFPAYSTMDRRLRASLLLDMHLRVTPEVVPLILGPDQDLSQAIAEAQGYGKYLTEVSFSIGRALSCWNQQTPYIQSWEVLLRDIVAYESCQSDTSHTTHFSPLSRFIQGYCHIFCTHESHVQWNEHFTEIARSWLQYIREAGADLNRYGEAERQWSRNGQSDYTSESDWKEKEDVFIIKYILYGPEIDDWFIYVKPCHEFRRVYGSAGNYSHAIEYPSEYEIAGEFWESIEDPDNCNVPGAYTFTEEEIDDAYATYWYPLEPIKGPIF